jgi:hypothetical protein
VNQFDLLWRYRVFAWWWMMVIATAWTVSQFDEGHVRMVLLP